MRIFVSILLSTFCLLSCKKESLLMDKENINLQLQNGVLYFNEKPFTGVLVSRYNEANFKLKLQYKNGRKDGLEKQWYANGKLSQRRSYANGVKTGHHLGWWDNGTPKFDYNFDKAGAYHGNRKEWYKNGQLMLNFNYVNGKEQGSQQMWNDTGKIKANYEVLGTERFGLIGLKKCYTVNLNSNELN